MKMKYDHIYEDPSYNNINNEFIKKLYSKSFINSQEKGDGFRRRMWRAYLAGIDSDKYKFAASIAVLLVLAIMISVFIFLEALLLPALALVLGAAVIMQGVISLVLLGPITLLELINAVQKHNKKEVGKSGLTLASAIVLAVGMIALTIEVILVPTIGVGIDAVAASFMPYAHYIFITVLAGLSVASVARMAKTIHAFRHGEASIRDVVFSAVEAAVTIGLTVSMSFFLLQTFSSSITSNLVYLGATIPGGQVLLGGIAVAMVLTLVALKIADFVIKRRDDGFTILPVEDPTDSDSYARGTEDSLDSEKTVEYMPSSEKAAVDDNAGSFERLPSSDDLTKGRVHSKKNPMIITEKDDDTSNLKTTLDFS